MNLNLLRTLLAALAGIIPILTTVLGCVTDAVTGELSCTASWLPPKYAAIASSVLIFLNLALKAFGQGGNVAQNLANKSVVVTEKPQPGTVTEAQVRSS